MFSGVTGESVIRGNGYDNGSAVSHMSFRGERDAAIRDSGKASFRAGIPGTRGDKKYVKDLFRSERYPAVFDGTGSFRFDKCRGSQSESLRAFPNRVSVEYAVSDIIGRNSVISRTKSPFER